jgi:ankyrin repeat protein
MKNNYILKPQLFSFILLINLFLQGCKHSYHSPTPIKEPDKGHLQVDIKKLTGNKFVSKEGYPVTFYQQQGALQADVKEGHGCMHRIHKLLVYVEHGKAIEQLLHFIQKGSKDLIHIILPEGKTPGFVYLGESGLMGGSNTGREKGKEKLIEDGQPQAIIDINDSEKYQQLLSLAVEGEAEAQFLRQLDLHTIYFQPGSSSEIPIARENLAGLPVRIWEHILSYLRDSKELISAKQVNSIFDGLVEEILSNRLQEAIIMADETQAREVIKARVNMQIGDENGIIPLYLAADKGHLEIVKLLLRAQKDSPFEGITRFDHKASGDTIEKRAESLIESVAQLKLKNKYINDKDKEGNTPLHLAAEKGQLGRVNLFLEHRRACMYTQNHNGQLPLHLAAQQGHAEIVALLGSVYAIDNNGQTPLHLAAHKGHLEVARVLIANGAEVNAQDNNRKTPLQLAALNNHSALEKFLLEKAQKPNNRNRYGFFRD